MTHLKWYALLALIILLGYTIVIVRVGDQLTQEHEARVNEHQALQTQLSAQGIEAHFQWVLGSIANLSASGIPRTTEHANSPDQIEHDLAGLLEFVAHTAYPEEKIILRYVDAAGNIIATYLRDEGVTPDDLARLMAWLDEYGAEARASGTYFVTPFEATADNRVYGILYPVFDDTGFIGTLLAMLDFDPVLEQYAVPIRSGSYGAIWIQDSTSYVIYDHEPETIGELVSDLAEPYSDLQRVNAQMMTVDSGKDHYHYTVAIGGEVRRKLVAWSTAYLGNQRLTVALSAPDTEINADVAAYRKITNLVGVLLAATLIVGSAIFYATRQRDLKQLVDIRTHELQQLNSELEQRVTERTVELTQKNAQLSTILETMEDGVIFRRDNTVVFTNPAITRLLGYTQDEVQQNPQLIVNLVRQHIADASFTKFQRLITHTLQHGSVLREDLKLTRKDGETLFVSLYIAGIHASDGTTIGTLEIIHDNSHAVALQQQKDRFITNASHELRRPLSNLKTRLYLLRQQPDQLPTHLEVLERATNDMTDLVRDLVDVAQFTRDVIQLNRQNLTVQAILDSARALQEIIAKRKNVQLAYDIPPDPLPVFGDYQRLAQAISNVVIYVINTTPPNGTISLQLSGETGKTMHWGIIRVVDHNCNLEESALQEIFNPFFRPSEGAVQSTGLGLTIAHLIIEQHSGAIDALNNPEGGIVFVIRLPLTAPERLQTT